MCGRYALYGPVSRLREAFDAVPEGFEFEPRWNAAPLQWLPVVRQRSELTCADLGEPGRDRLILRPRRHEAPAQARRPTNIFQRRSFCFLAS